MVTSDPAVTTSTTEKPATTAAPAVTQDYLRLGDSGPAVEQLQTKLVSLGFRIGGEPDGDFGSGTASAVLAFQKFEGLDRDSVVGPRVLAALDHPTGAVPPRSGTGPHLEIDLARQVLFAWTDSGAPTILNTSTGNGELYVGAGGSEVRADTPTGDFTIERRIDGIRESFLGTLYRPLYFYRGWAIHGSPNVPAQPASHGCARVRNADQDWLFATFADGTTVSIH